MRLERMNLPDVIAPARGAVLETTHLVACPNPFAKATKRIDTYLPAGLTIAEMIEAAGADPMVGSYARVWVNDLEVPREYWSRVRPKPGALVTLTTVPHGGGGKNPLRTVLTIAVIVAAAVASVTLGPQVGALLFANASWASAAGTAIVSTAVTTLGTMAVNALVPPPKPRLGQLGGDGATTSRTLSITGTRNQLNPLGPVPRIFGRHRVYPNHGAKPFTENVGDDQYLVCLFDLGYGPLLLEDHRIGTTPLAEFEDVELEVREGWDDDEPLTLYRNDVTQDDYSLLLTQAGGPQVVETQSETDEIIVDFTFQGLVRFNDEGKRTNRTVMVQVAYRPAGSADPFTPVLTTRTELRTALVEIEAPAGETYTVYRTDGLLAGPVTITLQCPPDYEGARLHFIEYRVYTRLPGQTQWRHQASASLHRFDTKTIQLLGQNDRRLEIKLERVRVNWQWRFHSGRDTEFLPPPPLNTETERAAPPPTSVSYRVRITEDFIRFTAATEYPVRRSVTIKPPSRGRYQVQVARLTPDTDDPQIRDATYLTAVKSITYRNPINAKGHCLVAMRIRANDQLNGVVDQYNVVAQAVLPVWTGTGWLHMPTRNPAWAYADVLRGTASKRPVPDSRLDLDGLKAWADACDAAGPQNALPEDVEGDVIDPYWTFDAVVDFRTTVHELLTDIAAVGRASFAMPEGKFSVVRDVPQNTPVQIFTPRNSWGFRGTRNFRDLPHGVHVKFVNEDKDWQQDQITVYADGFDANTATRFEEMEAWGCTRAAQAWREGRYFLAVGARRPETYQLNADIENLVCTRGDLVEVAHDVPRWGIQYARIKAIETDPETEAIAGITLDEPVSMQGGTNYALRVRLSDLTAVSYTVVNTPGETATLRLVTPVPVPEGPQVGDLAVFGEAERVTARMLVKEIHPADDLNALLILVDAAPEVHDADKGPLPPLVDISTPPIDAAPPYPVDLEALQSVRADGGRYAYDVSYRWRMPNGTFAQTFEVYRQIDGRWRLQDVVREPRYALTGLEEKTLVTLAVLAVSSTGQKLPLTDAPTSSILVGGDRPPSPEALAVDVTGETATLSWRYPSGTEPYLVRHVHIRYSPVIDPAPAWTEAVDIVTNVAFPATTVQVPALPGTYLAKFVSPNGLPSGEPARAVAVSPGLKDINIVERISTEDGFTGEKENVWVRLGRLRLDTADRVEDWPAVEDVPEVTYGLAGLAPVGHYHLGSIDLGARYVSRVTGEMSVVMVNVMNLVEEWPEVLDIADVDGADGSEGDVRLEVRTTEDDPAGTPTWSDWRPVTAGELAARALEFRVALISHYPSITPDVGSIAVTVDMPDRVIVGHDLLSDPAGSLITFDNPFKGPPVPVILPFVQDLQPGDEVHITEKSPNGFRFRVTNAGIGVVRTFDFHATGYGKQA